MIVVLRRLSTFYRSVETNFGSRTFSPTFQPYRDADGVFISIVQLKKPFGSSNSIADTSADNQKVRIYRY